MPLLLVEKPERNDRAAVPCPLPDLKQEWAFPGRIGIGEIAGVPRGRLEMRVYLGAAVWIALIGLLVRGIASSPDGQYSPARMLVRYATRPAVQVPMILIPPQIVAVGDPVFLEGSNQTPAIGRIEKIEAPDGSYHEFAYADRITVRLYPGWEQFTGAATPEQLSVAFHETPKSMGWVVQTMLPPAKRRELIGIIMEAVREHQPEIVQRLQPLLLESLEQSGEVIREELRRAIDERQERIRQLAGRYQVEIVQQRLVPLFSEVIWPIVQEEGWPVASGLGQEVWAEASLWRLTWRYLYDISPLPQKNLTQQEFERLVRDQISPLLARWLPEIYAAQRRIFQRIAENSQVREVAAGIMTLLANDAELQSLVLEILREALTDNPRLVAVWREIWQSPEALDTMADMNQRLEPAITGIGEAMFGNPRTRITPEFSTVLRNKVLFKDERWLTARLRVAEDLAPGEDGRIPIVPGPPGSTGPFHVPARPRQ